MTFEATAGHCGPEARSDCWVRVWRPEPGTAPEVTVRSKVASMYGPSIHAQLIETRTTLGADDLSIEIDDQGALPYTLMARLEAAVRRLRPETRASALSPPPAFAGAGLVRSAERGHGLRRSRLYLPGDAPKFFINAGLHRPDAVILDLEDAVAPAEKDAARILVRNALLSVDFCGAERMVRVNALPAGLADIAELAPHGVDVFVLPKVESADAVAAAHACIQQAYAASGLLVTIETAKGVLQAAEIAAAPGVVALNLGLEDYAADIGATRTRDGRESAWARGQVLNAARAAGVQPLASVYADIDDADGFLAWARGEQRMGFEGVACLHPRQVALAHRAFAPTPEEVALASRIVEAFEAGLAAGVGAIAVDGRMVDAPVAARARRALARNV
ncbi:MAG: aldolase/citrate lyase family protein [Thermoflexales bacterium]